MELRKYVFPELIFGQGALDLAGRYAKLFNARKVLLVSDEGVIEAGWVKRCLDSLEQAQIKTEVFAEVSPNPRASQVVKGVDRLKAFGADLILAVGGGSPMDCAKAISISYTNHRDIRELVGVDRVPMPGLPLICVPTTAGSSADVSQFAIISDQEQKTKLAIISKVLVPDLALVDPEPTTTMDPYLTACTGIDALVHAIEALCSTASSRITNLHALAAIETIGRHLESAVLEPHNLAARTEIMHASMQAGLAFSNASLGAVHAMAHALGGTFDLAHGECNALLLEHVLDFNWSFAPKACSQLAAALLPNGLDKSNTKQQSLECIHQLKSKVGITRTLSDIGLKKLDIPLLARKAMADPCMATNPRLPQTRDIETLYEEAL